MNVFEHCARALHQRDVDDPACEPDQRDWDRLSVKFQDEYRADARAVLDAANYQGLVDAAEALRKELGDIGVDFASTDAGEAARHALRRDLDRTARRGR